MARRTSDAQSIMNVPVDDSSIGNGKVLAYNSTSGALEYVTPSGAGDMLTSTYDAANVAEQLVGLTAIQTLTNKTLTSPVLNTGVSGTAVLDEDNMASNSATQLATQQSIKAYVDGTNVTLAGTGTYITIAGQVITVDPITESDIADLGAYITGITGEPLSDLSDVTITTIASGEILKWNGSAWINQTLAEAGIQGVLSEGAFVDGDKTKLDGIEASADVTDTANVTAAGALMDSEVTNLAAVKAFDPTDYVAATGDTMEGDLNMGGNNLADVHEIQLDGTPDTDHTANGPTTSSINAAGSITAFTCVYLDGSGTWSNADASATATADKMLAIALEAGSAATAMKVALPGSFIRDDTWAWTVGGAIYLSETTGALTQTAPTTTDAVVRVLGYAVSADVMYFMPETGVVHA